MAEKLRYGDRSSLKNVKRDIKKIEKLITEGIRKGSGERDATLLARLANLYFRNGEYKKAAETYEEAGDEIRGKCALLGVKKKGTMAEVYFKKADEIYEHLLPEKRSSGYRFRKKNLEQTTAVAVAIIGLIGGIFFLSSNFTGFAIANNTNVSNIVGVIFFLVGIVGAVFYFRKNKKNRR